jgi:hypothetical protein
VQKSPTLSRDSDQFDRCDLCRVICHGVLRNLVQSVERSRILAIHFFALSSEFWPFSVATNGFFKSLLDEGSHCFTKRERANLRTALSASALI